MKGEKLTEGSRYSFHEDPYTIYEFIESVGDRAKFTEYRLEPSDGSLEEVGEIEFDAFQITWLERRNDSTKHWFWIEDCTSTRSEVYDEILLVESKEEALNLASAKWEALTESDRRKRDAAFIGYAGVYEDGYVDFATMTDIVYLKQRKK